jgi:hypothetical protein
MTPRPPCSTGEACVIHTAGVETDRSGPDDCSGLTGLGQWVGRYPGPLISNVQGATGRRRRERSFADVDAWGSETRGGLVDSICQTFPMESSMVELVVVSRPWVQDECRR